jgi:hypothetical protein
LRENGEQIGPILPGLILPEQNTSPILPEQNPSPILPGLILPEQDTGSILP